MTRTQLYLPQSQYEELKQLAQKSGKTFAALTREFLEQKLREVKGKKKSTKSKNYATLLLESLPRIEKLKGGISDGSLNLDHYLYGGPKIKP